LQRFGSIGGKSSGIMTLIVGISRHLYRDIPIFG
jgi:hypothetical protein